MDPGFVGLIVSCFNDVRDEKVAVGSRLQVVAFQSVPAVAGPDESIDTSGMDSPTRRAILESSAGAQQSCYSFATMFLVCPCRMVK